MYSTHLRIKPHALYVVASVASEFLKHFEGCQKLYYYLLNSTKAQYLVGPRSCAFCCGRARRTLPQPSPEDPSGAPWLERHSFQILGGTRHGRGGCRVLSCVRPKKGNMLTLSCCFHFQGLAWTHSAHRLLKLSSTPADYSCIKMKYTQWRSALCKSSQEQQSHPALYACRLPTYSTREKHPSDDAVLQQLEKRRKEQIQTKESRKDRLQQKHCCAHNHTRKEFCTSYPDVSDESPSNADIVESTSPSNQSPSTEHHLEKARNQLKERCGPFLEVRGRAMRRRVLHPWVRIRMRYTAKKELGLQAP